MIIIIIAVHCSNNRIIIIITIMGYIIRIKDIIIRKITKLNSIIIPIITMLMVTNISIIITDKHTIRILIRMVIKTTITIAMAI